MGHVVYSWARGGTPVTTTPGTVRVAFSYETCVRGAGALPGPSLELIESAQFTLDRYSLGDLSWLTIQGVLLACHLTNNSVSSGSGDHNLVWIIQKGGWVPSSLHFSDDLLKHTFCQGFRMKALIIYFYQAGIVQSDLHFFVACCDYLDILSEQCAILNARKVVCWVGKHTKSV